MAAAPALEEPEHGGLLAALLPAVSGIGILAWAVMSGSRLMLGLGVAMVALMLGAGLLMRRSSRRAARNRTERRRQGYRAHLDAVEQTLLEAGRRQREAVEDAHPGFAAWGQRAVSGERLWERRCRDPDALRVRLGRGRVPLALEVRCAAGEIGAGEIGAGERDEALDAAAREVVATASSIDDHPAVLDCGAGSAAVVGPPEQAWALVRSMVLELACARPPGELALVGLSLPGDEPWLSALPHCRGTALDIAAARNLLRPLLRPGGARVPLLVAYCAVDDGPARESVSRLAEEVAQSGGVVIAYAPCLADVPPGLHTVVALDAAGPAWVRSSCHGVADRSVARPDAVSSASAVAVSHALSGWSCPAEGGVPPSTALPELLDAARAQDGALGRLRIPLGLDADARPVVLDLDEPARGGDGPHGLVVGATGSGKSEALRTLVGGLLATRDCGQLAVVLVDYKGGATFRGLEGLPHVAGHVTNLDSEDLTARFADALGGELDRRQRLLHAAGHPDLDSWRLASANDADPSAPPAPPALLVVIDEFAELLEAAPDLLAVMVRTCRVGRSLGVHLLLATQRLDEGRLAGLDGHLRYRLCLRTGTAGESRTVLGVDDAASLPATPGAALLSVDGRRRLLQVARCSDSDLAAGLVLGAADAPTERLLEPQPARPIWQLPLPRRLLLGLPALGSVPSVAGSREPSDALRPAVGLVDQPRQQEQTPLRIDVGGAGGHVAVAGAPQSGTTTALLTLVCALALAHDPQELQVLGVAAAGAGLKALQDLPHVGTVAGPGQPELVRRTVLDAVEVVRQRGSAAAASGGQTVQQWRAAGRPSADGRGELLLVVDGWAAIQQDDELAGALAEIAADGLGVGVHLLVSIRSWAELRGPIRAAFGTRLELRLQDPYESEIDRRVAGRLTSDVPGRLVLPGGLVGQLALPHLSLSPVLGDLEGGVDPALIELLRRRSVTTASPVRLLPSRLPLPPQGEREAGILLGVAESGLVPQYLTQRHGRHLVVLGDAGSGRTGVLASLVRQHLDAGAAVHLIDPRGTSAGFRAALASYTTSSAGADALACSLGTDGADTRPVVVVVDDYDLLARGLASPLAGLADRLEGGAGDQQLTLVLARRVGGFARASFDPLLQRLLELGTCTLLLDGDPAEGPVLGAVRPRPLPPGRALLVRRGRPVVLVQAAVAEPLLAPTEHVDSVEDLQPAGTVRSPWPLKEPRQGWESRFAPVP